MRESECTFITMATERWLEREIHVPVYEAIPLKSCFISDTHLIRLL